MQENIRLGDIVIFEGEDDWLCKAICRLTHSTVTHAAMIYGDDLQVEMNARGMIVSRIETGEGNEVHLMRLEPEQPYEPLIAAAKAYLEEGVAYDFPALVLLAGLLIYQELRPTPRWQKITDLILDAACLALDKLLNRLIHKGEDVKAMVCSQLVYQIYLDCGKDYRIKIEDTREENAEGMENERAEGKGKARGVRDGWICLAELAGQAAQIDGTEEEGAAARRNAEMTEKAVTAALEQAETPDEEALARELYEALEETETLPAANIMGSGLNLDRTVEKVRKFLDLLEKILECADLDIPIPALFVTPADLYERAVNLNKVCDMDLKRV